MDETMRTVCATCGGTVWTERLIEHWRDFCDGKQRPATREPDTLLEVVWFQIDQIIRNTGFDRRAA